MHKIATAFTGAALALSDTAFAQKNDPSFSVNAGLVSDYRFRGISQSDGQLAIQAGIDLEVGNGFYVGTWVSQVDFDYGSDETDYEQDFYGGYSAEVNHSMRYDIGYIYYAYHGSDRDEDYQEIYGSLKFLDLTLGFAYSDDYWAESGAFYYPYVEYSFSLPSDLSLDLHIGLNLFSEEIFLYQSDSYIDYSATLSKEFGGLNLRAAFVGTDISDRVCFDTNWCEPTLLAGANYTW
ncbi:TorF family putative porin [Microbulbifer sp. 2205BS26-8]|uniref:TorF family putative porin n=1 Tax=Microbulbifer sp. 2205BS26-8 TaxID=3064386 RepID=UPI00273E78AE|nr:TorF family putative porin [Microbulbifer sp. 2205BS26-8]MDP5209622.1 TorF family putative porin [Microbulbifer sp. 2205BS26-8]